MNVQIVFQAVLDADGTLIRYPKDENNVSQQTFTCSKSTIKAEEKVVKFVQN